MKLGETTLLEFPNGPGDKILVPLDKKMQELNSLVIELSGLYNIYKMVRDTNRNIDKERSQILKMVFKVDKLLSDIQILIKRARKENLI